MESLNINQKTLLWLSANGISNDKIRKLLAYFGTPRDLWDNLEGEKHKLTLFTSDKINKLSQSRDFFEEKIMEKLKKEKAEVVTLFDEKYPKRLKQIEGSPYLLYYKGSLDYIDNISLAVVGSRKATAYGKWAAEKLTGDLSLLGVNIISGLAAGIDTIAHTTALKNKAKTFGIIACGINVVYPRKNSDLFRKIADNQGAVITEYPFDTQPVAFNFHDRNRIISGLADGLVVVEAQERSGTLITAGHAADQGREIFAVPGNIDSLYSKGTNALIRDGAKITRSVDDIIEEILELKERVKQQKAPKDISTLTDDELAIFFCLKAGKNTLIDISRETGMDPGLLLSTITLLEMKGFISQTSGNKFIIK